MLDFKTQKLGILQQTKFCNLLRFSPRHPINIYIPTNQYRLVYFKNISINPVNIKKINKTSNHIPDILTTIYIFIYS